MSRFIDLAKRIAETGSEGILIWILPQIISEMLGGEPNFNCYPGKPTDECYDIAFFFSLNGSFKSGGGHYGFNEMALLA